MKRPSRKQIIVPMNSKNKLQFMKDSSSHIANINKVLKNIKSEIIADFVRVENSGIVITIHKLAVPLDLQTIKQYIKNVSFIEVDKIEAPRLPQLKLHLKILGIPYLLKNSNIPILADVVEKIIKKQSHINNIIIASRSRVIKVLPKSDMAII